MNTSTDRRSEPRIPADGQVSMKVLYGNAGSGTPIGFRLAEDFSRGGLRFQSPTPLAQDQDIVLRMDLPHERRAIEQKATIRWTAPSRDGNQFDVGVKFTGASSKDASIWKRFVYQQQHAVA